MLKHAAIPPEEKNQEKKPDLDKDASPIFEQANSSKLVESNSPAALHELLEKNLKWSQIIYEQNRKINNKLLWSAAANWIRLFVLLVPFILAVIFLPPFVKEIKDRYGRWIEAAQSGKLSPSTLNDLLYLLPVNAVEKERINAMLK